MSGFDQVARPEARICPEGPSEGQRLVAELDAARRELGSLACLLRREESSSRLALPALGRKRARHDELVSLIARLELRLREQG